MKKHLLLSLSLLSTILCSAQDSLYSKVLYSPGGYKSLAIDLDANSNVAQAGVVNYNDATFSLLDSLGNILSSSMYSIDGQPASSFEFRSVAALSDGNYLVGGTVLLQNFGVNVGVVAKLSSTGSVLWSKGVFPQAPIYFACNVVKEANDNAYWLAGSDEQSGEMVISKLDTDGTLIDTWSYKNAGLRYHVSDIMCYGTDTLVFSGYTLDNGGLPQGLVFATDYSGNLLWNNLKPGYKFSQIAQDNGTIRLSTANNMNVGITSITPLGNFINSQEVNINIGGAEALSIAKIKDSTYALSFNDGFNSMVHKLTIGGIIREQFLFYGMLNDAQSREHNGLYLDGYGPIYGIKSIWFPDPHGNLVRTDSTLNLQSCGFSNGTQIETLSPLTDLTMTFTSVTDASIMDLLINQAPLTLNDSISCVDFYSGIEEEKNQLINLYPNPTSDILKIEWNGSNEGRLEFLDAKGQKVLEINLNNTVNEINLSSVDEGMYFYQFIDTQNQKLSQGKIIKQ